MSSVHVEARDSGGDRRALAFALPAEALRRFSAVPLLLVATSWLSISQAAGGGVPTLVVTTASGEVLVDVPLPADLTWRLEWTHSVARVQIVDVFAWRDGTMYVTDQLTPHLDIAGLGHFAGRGELMSLAAGGYRLANIDLPLPGNAHGLIIGSVRARSVLHVGDNSYALSETHPGTHARIEVKLR